MLVPEKMSKILIAAPKDHLEVVIRTLSKRRLFHIEDFIEDREEDYSGFRLGNPLEKAADTSKQILKLRSVTNAFSLRPQDIEPKAVVPLTGLSERIEKDLPGIEQEVEDLLVRRSALENRQNDLSGKIDALKPFSGIPVDLELLSGYRTLSVFAGHVGKKVEFPIPHEIHTTESKAGTFIVLVVPVQYRQEAERILMDASFQAVPVPGEKGSVPDTITRYSRELEDVQKDLKSLDSRIQDLKTEHAEFLAACDELLSIDIEEAEVPLRFAATEHAFVIEGWVPKEEAAAFVNDLVVSSGGGVFATELPLTHEDKPPVEYDNIGFAKPSQLLMDVYSRPRYTELDPTLVVAIIFPIFFGLILGDVGYGAVLLGLSLGLWKFAKAGEAAQLIRVLAIASISTIVCGILYSEVFGFKIPGIEPILPSRHLNIGGEGGHGPAIPELMIMVVWIGVAIITLGRILGIVNHARQDHGSHRIKAVLANLGWIMVLWGLLLLIWSFVAMPLMPNLTGMPGIVMGISLPALLGVVMMVLGVVFIAMESALEIVELPTILSHVLSFARIVGIGLSSVAIAMVVNFIAIGMIIEPQLENITIFGVVLIIIGALVFMIGHLLNTILGVLGAGIQSVRLNYVEFFTKFYKGGGKKYNPFGMIRRFTEE